MVLERGYAYCAVSIKGLELQETSCHTIEAGRIEDIFQGTFEKENGVTCCSWHSHPFDTLRPYDAATIKTYSDAKNVLTGVIDSPDALQKIADGFVQCLIWVMLHHNYKRNEGNFRDKDKGDKKDGPKTGRSYESMSNTPSSVKAWKRLSTNGSTPTMEESKTDIVGAVDEWESEIVFGETLDNNDTKKNVIGPPRPRTAESAKFKKRPQSAKSFSDSMWSNDSLMFESLDTKNALKVNLVSGMAAHQKKNRSTKGSLTPVEDNFEDMPGVLGGDEIKPTVKKRNSENKPNKSQQKYDDGMDDLSLFGDGDFGLPASDIHQKPPARLPPLFGKSARGSFAEITTLEEPAQFSCHYSKVFSPPHTWTQIPINPSTLEKYCENFPIDWYRHVLRRFSLIVEGDKPIDVTDQVADDKILQSMYSKVGLMF